MNEQLKFFIESRRYDRYDIHIDATSRLSDKNSVAEPIVFRDLTKQEMFEQNPRPALTASRDDLQQLFDGLYERGFRYSHSDEHSVGHLAATQKHLDDMRKIVSKKLQVELEVQ